MEKKADRFLIVLFTVFLFSFGILLVVLPDREFSPNENRYLQTLPKFTAGSVTDGSFMADFETYMSDQFPFRDFWVSSNTVTKELLFKKDIGGVYVGSDGYLLEVFDLPDETLQKKQLSSLAKFLARNESRKLYFAIAPNSVGVLNEKLPPFAPATSQKEYIENYYAALQGVTVIDLYSALEAKKTEPIYYKTDHHWTTRGAFYAYTALAGAMGLEVPTLDDFTVTDVTNGFLGTFYSKGNFPVSPETIQRFDYKTPVQLTETKKEGETPVHTLYDASVLDEKDKYAYFLGGNYAHYTIQTDAGTGKKLVLIKDSYSHCLIKFFTREYSDIHMLDLRYLRAGVNELIDEIDPDDILILYNAKTLSEDANLGKLAMGIQ